MLHLSNSFFVFFLFFLKPLVLGLSDSFPDKKKKKILYYRKKFNKLSGLGKWNDLFLATINQIQNKWCH